ncbi:DNA-binding PadR family transcriptional regulator [Murinocardiopsis flavida]|uniref:DNA-binding PadR family transcriptional regulator n=1 Tax=Murinocardiopsis flavida TaxID=645275 RepID=A0A2P8CM21_9ACTN|nr:helix-turn-helix transcriptional regulator [Murinocardiopsis flavida]PSK85973.1 DNA-binding PadR family transcriptional regulator [Murinocardiopsis flavida]
MSAIRLLVLGSVRRNGRAHGYQVRGDLESWAANEWSSAKPGSIYHALKQMAREGLLRSHETAPSTAGGPPRVEYELTAAGEDAYTALLRDAVTDHDQGLDTLSAAIGLIDDLPRAEAIALLRRRVRTMEDWRAAVTRDWTPGADGENWGLVGEVLGMWLHTADSRAEWARGLIARLEGGAYVMAGEEGR